MIQALAKPDPVVIPDVIRDRIKRAFDNGTLHPLRSYQQDRLADRSKFTLDNWGRQTAKSTTFGMESNFDSVETGESCMMLSASQDQSQELIVKSAMVAEVIGDIHGELQRAVMNGENNELLYVDKHGVKITQTVITLPNQARIIGRPANPRTARGFSMHVFLDEFGMHNDPDEIYAAAFPSITSRPQLRLHIGSTPGLRTDDKFADLCKSAERGESDFSYRKITIYDAVKAGLNVDPEQLKKNLRDDDRWRREFLCEFVDSAGAFLTYDLIRSCEHEGLRLKLPADHRQWDEAGLGWDPNAGDLFAGFDVGRRRDLSVIWILQRIGDVHWTRAAIELYQVPFRVQEDLVFHIMDHLPVKRLCIDETGIGMQMAEATKDRYGSHRVEPITFTANVKRDMAEPLRTTFEDKLIRIPATPEIREDLHSIQKTVTAAGNIRYMGERTENGHADRFWALALAHHAAVNPGVQYIAEVF